MSVTVIITALVLFVLAYFTYGNFLKRVGVLMIVMILLPIQ